MCTHVGTLRMAKQKRNTIDDWAYVTKLIHNPTIKTTVFFAAFYLRLRKLIFVMRLFLEHSAVMTVINLNPFI